MTLTACGKPAPSPSHSPWKTLRVSHRLTASTTGISDLTPLGTYPMVAPIGTYNRCQVRSSVVKISNCGTADLAPISFSIASAIGLHPRFGLAV